MAGQKEEHTSMPNQLLRYWTSGPGAAKLHWGVPGDFDACVTTLSKYVSPGMVKGLCANIHRHATGGWPGHAPGLETALSAARKKQGLSKISSGVDAGRPEGYTPG